MNSYFTTATKEGAEQQEKKDVRRKSKYSKQTHGFMKSGKNI